MFIEIWKALISLGHGDMMVDSHGFSLLFPTDFAAWPWDLFQGADNPKMLGLEFAIQKKHPETTGLN